MFIKELENELNYKETENGAIGYATTGNALLDLNFSVSSLRSVSDQDILNRFNDAWFENKELALKWLFFARDVRGGLGERKLFRVVLKEIAKELPTESIRWIVEYGRYDDLFVLIGTELESSMLDFIKKTLIEDKKSIEENKQCSLLAKWMPSINTSSLETRNKAKYFISNLGLNEKSYRKMLANLRKYIDVTEVKMSSRKWNEIIYESVPSRANLIYKDAFLRNDEKRRNEYLEKLSKGETKINSAVLFPHDIVAKYREINKVDTTLEGLWKGLPDYVNGNSDTIVVADGSGSMTSTIGNTNIEALDVANAIAIYFAEKLQGEFKDKYISFSENPQLVNLSDRRTLRDKINKALQHDEVANTNIEAVFDLILRTAIKNNMKQGEIPKNILIISDMEFDSAVDCYDDNRLFNVIENKYKIAGYKLPRLIFWNVDSRTGTIPITNNENGVALVSGFSPSVSKMVLSNKLDPFEVLIETLNSERYQQIKLKK